MKGKETTNYKIPNCLNFQKTVTQIFYVFEVNLLPKVWSRKFVINWSAIHKAEILKISFYSITNYFQSVKNN